MAGEVKDGASTVRALVRGTQTALYVQLFVAVLALGAIVFALVTLQRIQGEVEVAERARDAAVQETTEARQQRDSIAESTQSLLEGRDALADGRGEAAVILLQQSVDTYDGDATAWSLLGQALHGVQRNGEAVPAMQRAIAINATRFGDHARLATYLCLSGDDAGGRAALAAAPEGFQAALQQDAQLAQAALDLRRACTIVSSLNTTTGAPAPAAPSTQAPSTQSPAADAAVANPYKISAVFLHIREESDRPDAERLRERLQAAGYRVPRIELVPAPRGYASNLRYYYAPQAEEANAIARLYAEAAGAEQIAGWSGWNPRLVSLGGSYESLPRDRVEIWLPER